MTTTEKPAEYYDRIYKTSDKYRAPYSTSPYFPMWQKLVEWIPSKETDILDLGCGTGQLCNFLHAQGYRSLVGVDFSEEAIRIAKTFSPALFICDNIHTIEYFEEADLIIMTEVLEHLDDDIGLLKKIAHKHLIFSVPSFDDPAHVRVFKRLQDITERYSFLNITRLYQYKKWFLLECKPTT